MPATPISALQPPNFGNVQTKGGLTPPSANASADHLKQLVTNNWPQIVHGSGVVSKGEAAWLTQIASHNNADASVLSLIKEKLGGQNVSLSPQVASTNFKAYIDSRLSQLSQTTTPDLPPGGTTTPPVTGGTIGGGTTVTDHLAVKDFNRAPPDSNFTVNLAKAGAVWGVDPFKSVADMFSAHTTLPNGQVITAPTHMMGQKPEDVRIIAYDDALGPNQKDIARFVAPGEIAIAIKHHSPHPDSNEKEQMKLQCTHIEIAVGVETENGPGVITLNNPQNYQQGLFGTDDYPMIFIKPTFPEGLSNAEKMAYVDNMRTWLVIANTFTNFPGDYNGGDPLATRSPEQIKVLGDKLLQALDGNQEAIAWLKDPKNQVYCAELAHVALNLGMHVPLNKATLGADRFAKLKEHIKEPGFLAGNANSLAKMVKMTVAPEELKPLTTRLNIPTSEPAPGEAAGQGLAIQPFTVADIVERFIQATIPREKLGESVAPVQGEIVKKARQGLFEATGLDKLPVEDPRRIAADQLYNQLETVVGTQYNSYAEFRGALKPLLLTARKMSGPRDDGTGAFIPPHAYLLRATDNIEGKPSNGVLGWQYLGHGLHSSMLDPKS